MPPGLISSCSEKKWQPLPITEIQAKLEGLMLEMFGASKSHSIKRNDKTSADSTANVCATH